MSDTSNDNKGRKPRVIKLGGETAPAGEAADMAKGQEEPKQARKPRAHHDLDMLVEIPDDVANGMDEELTPPPLETEVEKRFSWRNLLFGALSGLLSLAIGVWIDDLVRGLFDRATWLGWVAVALTLLFVLALLVIIGREVFGLLRIRKINSLRERCSEALEVSDLKNARRITMEVDGLCEDLPLTARGRAVLKENANQVMDPGDLLALTERSLMTPLDAQAKSLIMNSAKRVSIVTAISPRAIVDVMYVLMENFRLIRNLSELYGGRPGTYGLWKLARMIVTHLAATGAVAIGDGLLQQVIGHGLASKLSRRLGEGVINGILTARIGISAMDICRPMPFDDCPRPGIGDFLQEIVRLNKSSSQD